MKIKTFVLSFLFVGLASMATAQKPANDVAIDGLHGKVKNVVKMTYEARTDFQGVTSEGDMLERLETAYNSKGWRKTMTYVTPEADVIFRSRFKHDGFGLTTLEQIVTRAAEIAELRKEIERLKGMLGESGNSGKAGEVEKAGNSGKTG